MKINLNADMGESYGAWRMGDDEALLDVVGSASVACGWHAGEPDVMRRTVRAARERGVSIGAHPAFPDLQGFGRRPMQLRPTEVENLVLYQLGALQAIAASELHRVTHVKPHGALYNMAARDADMAMAIARAVHAVDPTLLLVAGAGSAMAAAAAELGLGFACEAFADRSYEDDGTLTPRGEPDALVHDPELAAENVLRMATEGRIVSRRGRVLEQRVDTVCVHGDGPDAVALARHIRARLEAAGVTLLSLPALLAG